MAYLQSDLPPSTAPTSSAPRARALVVAARPQRNSSRLVGQLIAGLAAVALLGVLGAAAARATDSLAIGVMAADLAFLLAVAGWSTVVSGARR